MVAKVMSSGSSMASAVGYNEDKVKEGQAVVVAEVNADPDHGSVLETFARLERMNIRSRDVSFHMSVNPAETEVLTTRQVKELIGELMNGLGYGQQPYVIYRHEDIGRKHYHVVSIRVDHRGKKIPDRQERRVCNDLLKGMSQRFGIQVGNGSKQALSVLGIGTERFNPEKGHVLTQIEAIVQECLSYRFTGVDQFRMLMHSKGIDVGERAGKDRPMTLTGLDAGGRQCTPPVDERSLSVTVRETCERRAVDCVSRDRSPVREIGRVERICAACLPHAEDLDSFRAMLERKGIATHVHRDREGNAAGMTFMDSQTRCVLGPSEVRGVSAAVLKSLDRGTAAAQEQSRVKGNARQDIPKQEQQAQKAGGVKKM